MKEINLEEILLSEIKKLKEAYPNVIYYSEEETKSSLEFTYFISAMKEACKQTLELAAENANIELREYKISGEYESDKIGQEIMIEEPDVYIGISKQSILDTINQIK